MKKLTKERRNKLVICGCAITATALSLGGMHYAYHQGFQRGCDCLFGLVVKEFPDVNFSDFYTKYHK